MPSTVIRRFDYSPERRELRVEFVTGRRYLYRDVPEAEARAMSGAFAKGRYFNAHIRDRYRFRELGDEDEEPGATRS
jgi:lysyl-tRNA synthetase class 2